jgi:hypothetical protein
MFIPLGGGDPARLRAPAAAGAMGGADHFEVAMTCASLAALHADQGHFGTAEALGRRALRILDTIAGAGAAEAGLTLLNLATAIAGRGRRAEAVTVAARAEAILADRLPAGHPHIQAARDALCRLRIKS